VKVAVLFVRTLEDGFAVERFQCYSTIEKRGRLSPLFNT
jgi:hypothetical protein